MKQLLGKDQIAALGIEGGWTAGLQDFVRFAELDALNHVNNVVYSTWFETLRVLYMRKIGLAYDGQADLATVVRSTTVEYLKPMYMNQEYIVLCRTVKLGRSSFVIDYSVVADGAVTATATTLMVATNLEATKSIPVPDAVRQVMIEQDGAAT